LASVGKASLIGVNLPRQLDIAPYEHSFLTHLRMIGTKLPQKLAIAGSGNSP